MGYDPFKNQSGSHSSSSDSSSGYDPYDTHHKGKKKKKRGLLGDIARYSGAEFVGNLASNIGDTAVGFGPGLVHTGEAIVKEAKQGHTGLIDYSRGTAKTSPVLEEVVKPTVASYREYYGHDLLHHLYSDPLQPILDAATIASGGAAVGTKLGLVGEAVDAAGRSRLVTRSPRAIDTGGKGPTQTRLSSTRSITRLREEAAAKARASSRLAETRFGEAAQYGRGIQRQASRNALKNLAGYRGYVKATKHLRENQWAALAIRALDVHPDDLARLWRGTPNEALVTNPAIRKLVLKPDDRVLNAERASRRLSEQGENLLKRNGKLSDEAAAGRPELFKIQAEGQLGEPVRPIHGDPYYLPHVLDAPIGKNPLRGTAGGKGQPRRLGSTKQNLGVLSLGGKMHLRSDVLGPEFLNRVKHVKHDEIHKGLRRGSIRMTGSEIDSLYGGKLPKGYEYLMAKPFQKIVREEHPLGGRGQLSIPGVEQPYAVTERKIRVGEARVPHSRRGEGEVPYEPKVTREDLEHTPEFTTTDQSKALASRGQDPVYFVVPKQTAQAAVGEWTKANGFTRAFVQNPLKWWRSIVLGLRVGYLTNNLVGNSVMYGVRTGGRGALRDLIGAVIETHGRETALHLLNDPSTPPGVRTDLYREFFPDQVEGTFGHTQSPATSQFELRGNQAKQAAKAVTGAIPHLTHKISEELPRRALIRNMIRNSPEFKTVYHGMPRETRNFEAAARQLLEGKGGKEFQQRISKDVDDSLGNYLDLSPVEKGLLRNTAPFFAWYKAITTVTGHMVVDTPLRAQVLAKLGQVGQDWVEENLGEVPSFLRGAIPIGGPKGGMQRVLSTGGLNPYATLSGLVRGGTDDISQLGINPFPMAAAEAYAQARRKSFNVSPWEILAGMGTNIGRNLPPSRLAFPMPPSDLYPKRDRESEFWAYLGVPIKDYDISTAKKQSREGR